MLHFLRIENLALMDAVDLEFDLGFTAVTGETGAGKSVLLGALSLLSGARADKSMIRQGCDTCTLEAAIELPATADLNPLLDEMGLPPMEDGQLLIKRQFSLQKASRVWINGSLATSNQLAELGKAWIDFHGPGEPQKLFHEREQLALLDLFAGLQKSLGDYRESYSRWRRLQNEVEQLRVQSKLSPEEMEFLSSKIDEIDQLQLSEERIQLLEQDYHRVSSAQELKEICAHLNEKFLGGNGICTALQAALPHARKLAVLDPSAAHLTDRVESLLIEANDLSGEWKSLAFESDFDPSEIRKIESDMEKWMNLRRRYGASVEAILEKRNHMAQRLELHGDLEGALEQRQQQADDLEKQLRRQAAEIRSVRLKAAHRLAKESESLLRELGFKKPRLGIEISAREKLGVSGDSDCRMTFSPNPGSAMLPLNKIASSGEMARVMLALKSVLASVDSTPVLVFDEVDANIGGEVATAVARLLDDLGKTHQVFCITHLPQVAAVAKNHYLVEKDQDEESTVVSIHCLDDDLDRRIDEFARMLGDRSSAAAREHARRFLES